jgi:hypothetical protein
MSCSTPACRQWEFEEIMTKIPNFNGGRLLLGPDSDLSHLELALLRNSSGIRLYLNLLFLQARPLTEDPSRTSLSIIFEDQNTWTIYPYLLEGGQRVLIPGEIADVLIQSLLDEHGFTIQMGRCQIGIVPTNFLKAYQSLLELQIEE